MAVGIADILPAPKARQREVLYLPDTGFSVITGSAGAGKTLMALYRACYLGNSRLPNAGKCLFLTYNRALAKDVDRKLKAMGMSNVKATTYHSFLTTVLGAQKREETGLPFDSLKICNKGRTTIISDAVNAVKVDNDASPLFKRRDEFFVDEIDWILRMGIGSLDEYRDADRIGRGSTRLKSDQRPLMYDVYEEYLERLHENYDYDAETMPLKFAQSSICGKALSEYRHIIIDEGQDFPLVLIRAFAEHMRKDGSLTFILDNTQQVYGPRISWTSAGFTNCKLWELHENYRNTIEIYNLSQALASLIEEFGDKTDVNTVVPPKVHGDLPKIVEVQDEEEREELIRELADIDLEHDTCAILVSYHWQFDKIKSYIPDVVDLRDHLEKGNYLTPGIYVCTIHSAKGLEFDTVILPYLDAKGFISPHVVEDDEFKNNKLIRQLKTLYVAVTRARSQLLMIYSDELTELMPSDSDLYERVEA